MPSGDVVPVSAGGTGGASASESRVNLGALDSGLPAMRNALINGGMGINQRAFAGGSLAAGVYGFDRWKAGPNGASLTTSGANITLSSGGIVQVIEADTAAYMAGKSATFSVEDPSATISVAMAFSATDTTAVTGSITAGSGRRGVTLALPAGTGNLTVTISVSASTTFKRIQLELGAVATGWDARSQGFELSLCKRYCNVVRASNAYGYLTEIGYYESSSRFNYPLDISFMRSAPSISFTGNIHTERLQIAVTSIVSSLPGTAYLRANGVLGNSNGAAGTCDVIRANNDTTAAIIYDAEL